MGTSENKPSQQWNLCVFRLRNDEGVSVEGRTAKMKCEQEQKLLAQVRPYASVPVDTM